MTPPPTSAEDKPPRSSRLAALWNKSAGVFHEVQDALPPPRSAGVWLHLLRVPNLLTVPGDILAGFLLAPAADAAGWGRLAFAAAAGSLSAHRVGFISPDSFSLQLGIDLFLVLSPNPERQCVTVAEDPAFLAGIAFPKIPVTGAQLIASIPPEIEIVLLHGDGANYLTREQLAWFRAMLAQNA